MLTTDERIKEIEERATFRGKEGLAESFYRMNKQLDSDIPFLLALVKVQREALVDIYNYSTDSHILWVTNKSLNWQSEDER